MGEEVHGARGLRRRGRFWRSVRRALIRPSGLLLALIGAFFLGRFSARRPPHHVADTPAIRDAAELERSLNSLEARLTQGEGLVLHQQELKRRHERISALACTAAVAQQEDATRLARDKARRHRNVQQSQPSDDEDGDEAASAEAPSLDGHALAASRTGGHH